MVPFTIQWENSDAAGLNLSFLADAPAGKDGFITIRDGHFYKPSGERFKIWGVNLTGGACFPAKKDAPQVAAFLARFGINAVRFHFLDSNWGQDKSLFNYALSTTREFHPEQLDKLDFFIAELKKAGIYSNLNLNVGRTYRKEDGVPEYETLGFGKGATLFDDRLIDLQKEYARQLLTHVNPYTGKAYTDEPAVVIVEILNENSLVEAWFSGRLRGTSTNPKTNTWSDITPYYANQLDKKYTSWLKDNVSAAERAKIAQEAGVGAGADIPRLTPAEFSKASALRFQTEARFIISIERQFFTGMYDFLKKDLAIQSFVVATSDHNHYRSGYAMLSSGSLMDVVDGHVYWQHPEYKTDEKTGAQYTTIKNTAMVADPQNSTPVELSRSAVEGKPYTVSETNHPFPNEFSGEGIPILAAYALLQDWDGVFFYTLEHDTPDLWNKKIPKDFDIGLDPVKMAHLAASGLMFLRNDLQAAKKVVYRGYSEDQVIEGIREPAAHRPYFTEGFSPLIPLMHKTRIRSFTRKTGDYPKVTDGPEIKAETGEISWNINGKGFVEVSSAKTESLIGYVPEATPLLNHLQANLKNEFAAITLTALDNKPLASAEKMLLVATGRSGLTGMKWNEERTRLLAWGTKPTTIEPIKGEISLSGLRNAKRVIIKPLDGSGNPMREIISKTKKGKVTLPIGNEATVWYLIQVVR
jgi:hypothetical protein